MNKGKIVVLCPTYHALDAKVKDKYISESKINTSEDEGMCTSEGKDILEDKCILESI